MLLFKRGIVLFLLLALAGCGFQAAYGPSGPANGIRNTILVEAPENRNEYNFVKRLEERIGHADNQQYTLSYTITLSEEARGITPNQVITRYNVIGVVAYSITGGGDNQIVSSGKVDSFTSYSTTGNTVSTLTAKRDAYKRLMTILADQLTTRLIGTAASWAK